MYIYAFICCKDFKHTQLGGYTALKNMHSIEVGRYANLPRHTSLSDKCELGHVEDEFHFLFECAELQDLRKEVLPRFCHNNPNMLKLEA